MHEDVKKYAENNDIKGLRYIFVDCLDVDPTFEKYTEDFEYCKNIAGLFEAHKELTQMTENQKMWDDGYWVQLKTDMLKNFSRERFQHMRQVAQVVYAEKIVRITTEREQERRLEERRKQFEQENQRLLNEEQVLKEQVEVRTTEHVRMSKSEEEERRLEEKRKRLAQEYQRALDDERREKEQREKGRLNGVETTVSSVENSASKKVMGVVLIIVIILVIILIIVGM